MKRSLWQPLVALVILWSVGETAYRSGYQAGLSASAPEVMPPATLYADPLPPDPPHTVETEAELQRRYRTDNQSPVLVMPNGALYHNTGCPKVTGGIYIRLIDAVTQNYTPCHVCGADKEP